MDEHEHSITYKTYLLTWFWLLVLTGLALGLGYAPINERLKALLLVCTTLAKILVIAAIFMHGQVAGLQCALGLNEGELAFRPPH